MVVRPVPGRVRRRGGGSRRGATTWGPAVGDASIDELTVGDEPAAWAAAGFAVDDDDSVRVGGVRIRLVGTDGGRRIRGWRWSGLDPDGLDHVVGGTVGDDGGTTLEGLPTTVDGPGPCRPAEHRNGVVAIDHVVVLTPDSARTTAALEGAGLAVRRTRPTEQYGAPMIQTFFRAGPVIVELIGPDEPLGDGPAGFFGLAHTVADLDAAAALLGEHLGPIKDAVQPGRRIATLRHQPLGMSVATALMSGEPTPSRGAGGEPG